MLRLRCRIIAIIITLSTSLALMVGMLLLEENASPMTRIVTMSLSLPLIATIGKGFNISDISIMSVLIISWT